MKIEIEDLFLEIPEKVYEPREDSFLLLSVLKKINLKGKKVLDLGTGSGILGLFASKKAKEVLAVDINEDALKTIKKNVELNNIRNVRILKSDLFENIKEKFDLIIFNPPYVPSESNFREINDLAWAGGESGREIIDKFLDQFKSYLNDNGILLLLQSSLSDIDKTLKKISKFKPEIVASKKLAWETLVVIMAHK